MTAFETAMVTSLNRKIAKLEFDLQQKREQERQMIADIATNGGSMPNNYWLERHQVEAKLARAQNLLEAFR